MTTPTNTEKLAEALRKWRSEMPQAWYGNKLLDEAAAALEAHESRAQPASWPVELRAAGFNDAAAVIGYMDDIDAEVARITGDEGEDSSLQVLRRMPDYQPAQPASDFQPRFFIDHGVIHDRKRGRHVLGSQRDAETFGEPLQDTVDALNAMESATQSIGGLRVDYLDECRAQAQPASVADGWQPIDIAPRDGTLVIIAGGELQRPVFAWWTARNYWAGDQRGPYEPIPYEPACWMPAPQP